MAAKKCPNCNSDCPVASSSCKKCLHVFKSRKGSSNSVSSTSSIHHSSLSAVDDIPGAAADTYGRRSTGRITRSKPNFYDSLHVEEQMRQPKRVFVTVGTTKFEELVEKIKSENVIRDLKTLGFQKVVVQTGDSATAEGFLTISDLDFEFFRYKTEIKVDIEEADLVISHAGAGSVLDVLNLRKLLIVVPNSTLMNNHQDELADHIATKNYAYKATVDSLSEVLISLKRENVERVPLPPVDPKSFDRFLKEQLNMDRDKIRLLEEGSGVISDEKTSKSRISWLTVTALVILAIAIFLISAEFSGHPQSSSVV